MPRNLLYRGPRYFRVHRPGAIRICTAESSEQIQAQFPDCGVSEVSPHDLQDILKTTGAEVNGLFVRYDNVIA